MNDTNDTNDKNSEFVSSQDKIADFLNQSQPSKEKEEAESAEQSTDPKILELETALAAAKQEAMDNWDKLMRQKAEMQNLERRTQTQMESTRRYALERFAESLVPVLDSLEKALDAFKEAEPSAKPFEEGIALTFKMFQDVLAKFQVTCLDPKGQPFNPEFHEALVMQESADVPNNFVLEVVQKGYVLNGRIIRPARVVVAKAPASSGT